jgi:hypothetical protein
MVHALLEAAEGLKTAARPINMPGSWVGQRQALTLEYHQIPDLRRQHLLNGIAAWRALWGVGPSWAERRACPNESPVAVGLKAPEAWLGLRNI